MPSTKMSALALTQPPVSVLDRVLIGLDSYLGGDKVVDIVTFFESSDYLGARLYPRQRLVLKVYHRLPFEMAPCYLCATLPVPLPDCRWCNGTGLYDEFEDAKELLACRSIYARMYVPYLCQHHITGECDKEVCHAASRLEDYRILSDEEIRERLLGHEAYILDLVAGRRGSKSFVLAGSYVYSTFELVSDPSPQRTYGLDPSSIISIGNAANEEKQAKVVFDQAKNMMENSPWFQKVSYDPKDIEVEFIGRNITARCYHANAKSVRGGTNRDIYLDEFLLMSVKDQREMWRALAYSTATFARLHKRHVIIGSSPDLREGMGYDIFDGTVRGVRHDAVAFLLASWEMNPTLTRADFDGDYANDPLGAEIELGAQFADSVRNYIPPEAVDAAVRVDTQNRPLLKVNGVSDPRYEYSLHFDNSQKTDPAGLVITHWEPDTHEVITDWVEQFDPHLMAERAVSRGEIDQEKVLALILELRDKNGFRFGSLTFDQFNSAWLVQRLRKEFSDPDGDIVRQIPATAKSNHETFSTLRSMLVQEALVIPRHSVLIEQLKSLMLIKKEGSDAWKVEAPPKRHDDLADALAVSVACTLALAQAHSTGGLHVVEGLRTNTHLFTGLNDKPADQEQDEPPHSEGCTSTYCDMGCPWHRAFINGMLPRQLQGRR